MFCDENIKVFANNNFVSDLGYVLATDKLTKRAGSTDTQRRAGQLDTGETQQTIAKVGKKNKGRE